MPKMLKDWKICQKHKYYAQNHRKLRIKSSLILIKIIKTMHFIKEICFNSSKLCIQR